MSLEQQKLEHLVYELVRNDNGCSVHFNYFDLSNDDNSDSDSDPDNDKINTINLVASTFNPIHNTSFLLWNGNGIDKEDVLEQLLHYLKTQIQPKHILHYKIKWKKTEYELTEYHESYFVGKTALEVLRKFFHDKNTHDYVIYEMTLQPSS